MKLPPSTDDRGQVVEDNLGLVVKVMRRFLGRGLGLDHGDLLQIGMIAVWEASLKFDPTLGYKFSTLAALVIRRAMLKAINNSERVKKRWLPPSSTEIVAKVVDHRGMPPDESAEFREELGLMRRAIARQQRRKARERGRPVPRRSA